MVYANTALDRVLKSSSTVWVTSRGTCRVLAADSNSHRSEDTDTQRIMSAHSHRELLRRKVEECCGYSEQEVRPLLLLHQGTPSSCK